MENKFLDVSGVEYLYKKLSLEDYPNNEVLMAVINAIDENKLDKETYLENNRDIPRVYIDGTLPTTKNDLNAELTYISKEEEFHAYITIKCQGTSSMSYPKKNFTIKLFKDAEHTTKLKKNFNGWGAQNKFCLKANYIDCTHARNIICAKLWGKACESREGLNERLAAAPNYGAIDGFHIKVYANGIYQGLYTWNIPKDGWMFGMDSNGNEAIYCCEVQSAAGQFRQEVAADGSDWSLEYPDENEVNASVKEGFNELVRFINEASDDEFIASIGDHLDLAAAIDYYIYAYYFCALDQLGKNMLMVTFDGGKTWMPSVYDNDTTLGSYWDGTSMVSYDYQCPEQYECSNSLLWARIEELFGERLYQRYLELTGVDGAWSLPSVITTLEEFYEIPKRELYDEDAEIYEGIPQVVTMSKMRNYMANRKPYVDSCLKEIGVVIGIETIDFSSETYDLGPGESMRFRVEYTPEEARYRDVNFSCEPSVLALEEDGEYVIMTAPEDGVEQSVTVTVTCGDASGSMAINLVNEATQTHKAPYISFNSDDFADSSWTDRKSGVEMIFSGTPTKSSDGVFFNGDSSFYFQNTKSGNQDIAIEFMGTLEDSTNGRNVLTVGPDTSFVWNTLCGVWTSGSKTVYSEYLAYYQVNDVNMTDTKKNIHFLLCIPAGENPKMTVYANKAGKVISGTEACSGIIEDNYISNAEGSNRFYGAIRKLNVYDYIPNSTEVSEILLAANATAFATAFATAVATMESGSLSNTSDNFGQPVEWDSEIRTANYVEIADGAEELSIGAYYGNDRMYFYDENYNCLSQVVFYAADARITIPDGAKYVKWLHTTTELVDVTVTFYK